MKTLNLMINFYTDNNPGKCPMTRFQILGGGLVQSTPFIGLSIACDNLVFNGSYESLYL